MESREERAEDQRSRSGAMKCKQHPYEPGIGVCASCLRERLLGVLALITAQNQLSTEPPPLAFHRSVSPDVSHRRSDYASDYRHHHRFFCTPQVGLGADAIGVIGNGRRGAGRFSIFATLFGYPRSNESNPDSGTPKTSGSRSRFSSLIRGRRKKKSPVFEEETSGKSRSSCPAMDRGMSPVKDEDEEDDSCSSEDSTESASGWRRRHTTPMRRAVPAAHHHRWHDGRGVSGFAVCLSPLVRSSPNGRRGHRSERAIQATPKRHHHRHVSVYSNSLVPNRSRKLADFGRFS